MAKKAKESKMVIGFLLDETGSMMSVKQQAISGFNEYIETIRAGDNADSIRFTLTKFNSEKVEVVHDGVKLQKVAELTEENYQPNHLTPLYDAIGRTIRALEKKKGNKLIVIQTDGQENASREYDNKSIFSLIDEKKAKGWTFVFLGADQDAWIAGQSLGLAAGNVMSYDSSKTGSAFAATAGSTTSWSSSSGTTTSTFFAKQSVTDEE